MCGIAGIVSKNPNNISLEKLKKMTDIISHRGPDGEGQWISENGQVGLGHRRLSIIDLSNDADQPMHCFGRYSIVFNGEIYNYIELKEILINQGYKFKNQSDTEVLVALYDRDKENCLQLLDGMFSFVIYDKQENTIFCARDRFGEKPFFYSYKKGEYFLFGSEMKCLWEEGVKKSVNNRMMYNYLSNENIENPEDFSETFYENCTRLPHSHFIKIDLKSLEIKIEKYYDIEWKNIDYSITKDQVSERFNELFYTSIQRRLRSDVTVGSSLSGGIDSSLVVCIIDELKKNTEQKQNTFSAVFPGFKKDERKFMDYVIAKTNVEPHFITPNDDGLLKDIEKLFWHQEEPFGSASIYAQYCVMQLAKKNKVTVLLDGQGADEILAGYHGYYLPFFKELKKQNRSKYKSQYDLYCKLHSNNSINGVATKNIGDFIKSKAPNIVPSIVHLKKTWQQFSNPILNFEFYNQYKTRGFSNPSKITTSLNESLYLSTMKYGLQQLLRYADRNSMAHSIEVRLPFLSHELINFVFTLPSEFKINEGWTKWILRDSFKTVLPNEITWRKDKIGYEPPQKNWLTSPVVKDNIYEIKNKLVQNGILHKNILSKNIKKGNYNIAKDLDWKIWMVGNLTKI